MTECSFNALAFLFISATMNKDFTNKTSSFVMSQGKEQKI